jgi:hypothetical protein
VSGVKSAGPKVNPQHEQTHIIGTTKVQDGWSRGRWDRFESNRRSSCM